MLASTKKAEMMPTIYSLKSYMHTENDKDSHNISLSRQDRDEQEYLFVCC